MHFTFWDYQTELHKINNWLGKFTHIHGRRDCAVNVASRLQEGLLCQTGTKDLSLNQGGQTGSGSQLASYSVGAEDSRPGVKVTGAGSWSLISPSAVLYLHSFLHAEFYWILTCMHRSTQHNYRDKRIIDCRSRSLVLLVHCFSPTVTFRAACYRGGFA